MNSSMENWGRMKLGVVGEIYKMEIEMRSRMPEYKITRESTLMYQCDEAARRASLEASRDSKKYENRLPDRL